MRCFFCPNQAIGKFFLSLPVCEEHFNRLETRKEEEKQLKEVKYDYYS